MRKKRITINYILLQILCLAAILFFVKLVIDGSKTVDGLNFKKELEYKLLVAVFIILAVYFILAPRTYFDETNFYIKRLARKEIVIPIENITSIFRHPFSGGKGTSFYTVEYLDNNKEMNSIKFAASYWADRISDFISHVKKSNPKVEIV